MTTTTINMYTMPVAVPTAQLVHVPDADMVSCSCQLLAYLLSFCYQSLVCFAGSRSIVSRFPAYVFFCDFALIIALLLEGFIPKFVSLFLW